MRLYMPRFYTLGLDANLANLRRDVEAAASDSCDAVMFPEVFLTGYHGANDPARVRGEFAALSTRYPELLCIFGTISEEGRNRLPVYLGGTEVARYDKVHLFHPNGEGELWRPGDRYTAYAHGDWRIGLATCNDLRFPEQSRALKLQLDVNLMLYPALWPWQRDHVWRTLLRARAIENGCFTAGCCLAGVDNGAELFDGAGSYVFDPLGRPVYAQGRVYELDLAVLDEVLVDTRAQYREPVSVELL
jgi:omega-amidase